MKNVAHWKPNKSSSININNDEFNFKKERIESKILISELHQHSLKGKTGNRISKKCNDETVNMLY